MCSLVDAFQYIDTTAMATECTVSTLWWPSLSANTRSEPPLLQNTIILFAHEQTFRLHCTKQGITATAFNQSKKCWWRRPHFPFGGLLTIAEIKGWILSVRQWLMWTVFQFPGKAQQPSESRYLLFLWQLGRRCVCWPVHHIWRFGNFVGRCLVRRCTCLCGSVASVWFCTRVWDSDIPGHWLASGPWDQCPAVWTFPILQNQISRFLCCRNLRPFHSSPQNIIHIELCRSGLSELLRQSLSSHTRMVVVLMATKQVDRKSQNSTPRHTKTP